MKPEVTHKQAKYHLYLTLKNNYSDVIKEQIVVGQGTTTQKNVITVVQQLKWHYCIDSASNLFLELNMGLCKCGCLKSLGKLNDEFIMVPMKIVLWPTIIL